MIGFLLANQNLPFTIALAIMLIIAFLEGVSSVMGLGIFTFIDTLLPDLDLDLDLDLDMDMDADMGIDTGGGIGIPDIQHPAPITRLLTWFRIGEVPAIVLLIVFLTGFGLIGICGQRLIMDMTGTLLPGLAAGLLSLLLALPLVRVVGGVLARIVPKDETDAVSEDSFIGRIATITLGKASQGSPAQAKLKDAHGRAHYVMVEPDQPNEMFGQGARVLLVRQQGALFKAVRNRSHALED